MKTALITGSFDPVTLGHLDIIRRSSSIFKKVIVGVGVNPTKKYIFSIKQRADFIKKECDSIGLKNVEVVEMSDGKLSSDLAYEHDAVLIKGVRINADFDYEKLMNDINHIHNSEIDTMIFPCNPSMSHISSTAAKEVCKLNGNTEEFLPLRVKEKLENYYGQYRIGITGGIACGKSTLVKELETRFPDKVFNVDLDEIASDILFNRTEPLYVKIRENLKEDLDISGEWNKKVLAEKIFSHENLRKHLNKTIRPAIYTRIREILSGKKGLILFNTALLVEANMMSVVNNNVVIVGTPTDVQVKRLLERGHSHEMAEKRISAQLSTTEKIKKISEKIVLDNYGFLGYIDGNGNIEDSVEEFKTQVKNVLGYEL